MAKNARTGKGVGSTAPHRLRGPGSLTNKRIKAVAASALTQRPDHKKPTRKSPPETSGKSAGQGRLSAAEPDQAYQPQPGAVVVRGHFDAVTGLSTVTDAPSLGLGGTAADEPQSTAELFNVVIDANSLFRIEPAALKRLANYSDDEIFALVVPKRTLARRLSDGEPLTVEETDKAVRLARVDRLAANVFGEPAKAHRWLRKPKKALGGETPLAYLATEAGARVVEEMLHRIDHGILA
ncbi:antitoxin Xre/MbcA/ParS toxin-binding domain-containing protein [Bradyrhizobium sp. DN5]|uniref:type II RES/Xre toxin-antitoxin system antitoxin n=1 Tax=Bradyrhizobium sp. DN5 TaxID=3056950 RepID=UPI00352682FB